METPDSIMSGGMLRLCLHSSGTRSLFHGMQDKDVDIHRVHAQSFDMFDI